MSTQSMPSVRPLTQIPPSDSGSSSWRKRVRYDRTGSAAGRATADAASFMLVASLTCGPVSRSLPDGRTVLFFLGCFGALFDDRARLRQPALVAAPLQHGQYADADKHPYGDDDRRPVIGVGRERAERFIERVDEHDAGAHREDEM